MFFWISLLHNIFKVNGFLMLIVQFVVSVVCAFMAGYMGPYLLYGRTDMGSR